MEGKQVRRTAIITGLSSALILASAGIANAGIIGGTGTGGGCGGGPDITYSADGLTLYARNIQLPGGPATNIYGQALFVTQCQPVSGTAYLDLKLKTSSTTWTPQIEVSRDLGEPLPRGWSMYTGGAFCSGRHTWKWVLTWHGVTSGGDPDSSPPGGIQYPSGSGEVFQCLVYGG